MHTCTHLTCTCRNPCTSRERKEHTVSDRLSENQNKTSVSNKTSSDLVLVLVGRGGVQAGVSTNFESPSLGFIYLNRPWNCCFYCFFPQFDSPFTGPAVPPLTTAGRHRATDLIQRFQLFPAAWLDCPGLMDKDEWFQASTHLKTFQEPKVEPRDLKEAFWEFYL